MPTPLSQADLLKLYFHYLPSAEVAIVGLVIFALFSVSLPIRFCLSARRHGPASVGMDADGRARHRNSRWLHWISLTALLEMFGFALRLAVIHQASTSTYALHQLLLIVSPNLLALCNYMAAGKFVEVQLLNKTQKEMEEFTLQHQTDSESRRRHWTFPYLQDPYTGLLIAKRISKCFLLSDVIAFTLQCAGGGMLTSPSTTKMGEVIMDVALVIQLFFFAGFTLLVYYVYTSPYYNPASEAHQYQPLFRCLFITIGLMTTRNLYRFFEFATGFDGPIASREELFYVFDTLVMILLFLTYFCVPMNLYLPSISAVHQVQPGVNAGIEEDAKQFAVQVVVATSSRSNST